MFKCDACGKTTDPGERMTKLPTEVRNVSYPPRRENPEDRFSPVIDPGGTGTEIVKEISLCQDCTDEVPMIAAVT